MKRREFITLLGGAAAAWPLTARGQEPGRIYRLGGLHASPRNAPHFVALFDELRRLGFTEGQNLVIDAAGYGLSPEQMEVHAADLVKAGVDVILAGGDAAVRAAQRATASIPILAFTDDMLSEGLVRSLAKPGGNTLASQFLPRSSTASGRKSSLRRCREPAASRCLRMPISARRLAFGRLKRPHAHAASTFQSTRLPIARKSGAPSTRRKRQVLRASTCFPRRFSSTVAHLSSIARGRCGCTGCTSGRKWQRRAG